MDDDVGIGRREVGAADVDKAGEVEGEGFGDGGVVSGRGGQDSGYSYACRGAKRPRRLEAAGIQAMDGWLAMLRIGMVRNYEPVDDVLAGVEKGEG